MLFPQYFIDDLKNRAGLVRTLCLIGAFVFVLAFQVLGQEPAKTFLVDEFANPGCEDLWARLDNFLVQMGNNPTATGTIWIAEKRGDVRDNLYYEAMIRNYLIERKLSPDRWRIIRTGPKNERLVKFWITPPEAQPASVNPSSWSFEYPPVTKPFIFTNGENYMVEMTVCIYVDEISLLAKVLDANPRANTNVVLIVRTNKEFNSRKRRVLKELVLYYAINKKKIRFFKRIDKRPNPYGIRPKTEYWFIP